ncbi:zinc finger, CCHC-type containing protein [Tanacetum coccineum]
MEQYMRKTRAAYGLGVAMPKIEDKDNFELKGQFLKELRSNTFSGSDHEDANKNIEKVLEIVDLFHIPNITIDQVMLRAFPIKYYPPARTTKKMEEINNFQQESDETLYQAWERFKELLMKCPQQYLTEMQERCNTNKTDADAKVAIQVMAEYSQKWYNRTSRIRSTETSEGLAAIQAQLNNIGREIKKVNEKVYAAQVGCEQCKGPHYTKDFPLKEEGKTLEEAYYTQFGRPFQGGGYRVATPGFYQRNNANPSYKKRRQSTKETLSKFMSESAKRDEENSNMIKEIRALIDATVRNQGASIKNLEIQIRKISKGLEVGSIRRIQGIRYGVLEFLGVGTTHGYAVSSLMDTVYWSSEAESRVLGVVVRLLDPKLKTLGEKGIECIFVGYAIHSKAFRFSSVPRPSQRSLVKGTEDYGGLVVPENITEEVVQQPEPELSKSKRHQTPKDFRPEFQLYLIERTMDEVFDQHSYCINVEDDPKTFDEAIKSQDVAFWKEVINDEMDSIMGNNTWVFADIPPGCKPLGCKWIFKRKLKVDGTIEKFKARLVIQGFKQKSGIYCFDTYAPIVRISTVRLLIAMTSIHSLIIHQMDVKTTFLNGELEEEVYMNQPQGFIMPGNENKVCKMINSLYGLKQAPKQWHQKFDEVVLSNGYLLNQADKCVCSKFDKSGKGVIVFLYVDDMLIFGTDQVQVDLTNEFLSLRFSMKDMGEADVILGIRIKHDSNGIAISQSHYIEKVLKKFNYFNCTPVSTHMDTSKKLMPNNGQVVSQLEYSRVIGYLMSVMTCTRPDIAFVVGKLSSSTMESEFVALAATGKEVEWLKNLLLEIPLWVKPIALISIRYDSAATLAKAYSHMYNGKSRHLGVRHSMIHERITNGVVSLEFVRSQQNLDDHFTKGLARDLVIKSAERMGLKSN